MFALAEGTKGVPRMEYFRRLDRVWARGEGMLTLLVLLSMVSVAGFSAAIRNLTRFEIDWAARLLTDLEWADSFLRKGTMWLAFLGASQATYYRKHIAIDVLTRIAPLKQRYMMHAAAGVIAGLITFALAFSLGSAVKLNLSERPIEYEMLAENGSKHLCEGTKEELKSIDVEIPHVFCGVRSALKVFGVTAETPGAAFQMIVPFMFFVIGLRFLGAGFSAGAAVIKGEDAIHVLEAEEQARLAAVHAAASGMDIASVGSIPAAHGGAEAAAAVSHAARAEIDLDGDPDDLVDEDEGDDGAGGPQTKS